MPFIWTDSLNMGIGVIDGQHQRIVAYLNALEQARLAKDKTGVGQTIEQLIDYTQSHFGFEEALMADAGYKFLKPHQRVHELFIRRVNDFTVRAAKGEDIAEELQSMLSTWLLNHIAHEDRDYAAAVKKMTASEDELPSGRAGRERRGGLLRRFFGARA